MAKKTKRRQQQIVVLVAAAVIIAASVVSTLYFTGYFSFGSGAGKGGVGYQNITFTDAYLECESYTRERYESRLQSLAVDNHSSRYENASKLYKIYFQLQMRKPPHAPQPEPYWVNCFVSASDGDIVEFQVGEGKDLPVDKPITENPNNTFGWP